MKPSLSKTVTIALCGAQPRIGTTTQALQILQYLQIRGYDVAYIDLSGQGYIDQICRLYGGVGKKGNCVEYEGIHMYRSVLGLNGHYQYLIKDYGPYQSDGFNETSYLEQDIHIVCAGVKPNEIFEVSPVLQNEGFNRAKFIFTFVPPDHRSVILAQMTNRAANTCFVGYNPEPFAYDATSNKAYRQIIGDLLSDEVPSPKKKHLLAKLPKSAGRFFSVLGKRFMTFPGVAAIVCVYTACLLLALFKFGLLNIWR